MSIMNRKEYAHEWYLKHREIEIKRALEWHRNHPERSKEIYRKYKESEKGKKTQRECERRWKRENPDKVKATRERNIEWYRKYARDWHKKSRAKLHLQVIMALGGKCSGCGFSDIRALQVDHINGGGNRELKQAFKRDYRKFFLHVIESIGHGKYQLLCANCNVIKAGKTF